MMKGVAPQFVVKGVVRAAEYYRDRMGFQILDYFLDPPVFAMVKRDGVEIHLGKADEGIISPNCARRRIAFDAYIWVDDLDVFIEEFRKRGATIVEGPIVRIYGMREILVEDTAAFRLAFGEPHEH